MIFEKHHWIRIGLGTLLLPLAACEGLLDVEAPGRIADDDLNNTDAIESLVVGMSSDMMEAMDGTTEFFSLAAGELWHGGSYDWAGVPRGLIEPEDVDGSWATMQEARWVAEDGIRRIQEEELLTPEQFAADANVARAYLFAGIANRFLGETVCEAVIDGGPREEHTVHFPRAIEQFTQAIQIGTAAGATDVVNAAYGGRAAVRAWTGDWAGAAEDAAQVPVDFVYLSLMNAEQGNILYYETHDRYEYTVYNTVFAEHPDDPRAPWEIIIESDGSVAVGANGATPHYQQEKYSGFDSDIPLVKGTESLLIRAEAALRNNDIAGATALMNEARAYYDMDALPTPASVDEAWAVLQFERGATLWLENRRLWDLRRWTQEGVASPEMVEFTTGRQLCMPISEEELRSNPNL